MGLMRSSRSGPLAAILPALLVAAAAGCARSTTSPAQWAAELAAARAKWQAAGYQNYTYGLLRYCNCVTDQTRPFKVTIVHGALNRIVYTDSIGGYADTTLFRQYLSMDRYFQLLDQVLAESPAEFNATYSATLGIPTYVSVNISHDIVDEEFSVQTLSFTHDSL